MTVTRDKDTGELVRIDMTQTVEGKQSDGGKVKGEKDNGETGEGKKGGSVTVGGSDKSSDIDIVTNSIVFEKGDGGAADRQVAEDWLDGSGDNTAPFEYMFGDHARRPVPTPRTPSAGSSSTRACRARWPTPARPAPPSTASTSPSA